MVEGVAVLGVLRVQFEIYAPDRESKRRWGKGWC